MKKFLVPIALLCLAGCVDPEYDKEIDTNIVIAENGVAIPIGETERLTLSKLIDTGDDLKVDENGVYYISQSTSASTVFNGMSPVHIDQNNGLNPYIEPTAIDIPASVRALVEALDIHQNIVLPAINISTQALVDPADLSISKDVDRIDLIVFEAPINATITLKADVFENQGPASLSFILSDVNIALPHMLMLSPSGEIGNATLNDTDDSGNPLVIENHTLKIPKITSHNESISFSITIYGLYGGKIQPDGTNDFVLTHGTEYNTLDIKNNDVSLEGNVEVHLDINGAGTVLKEHCQLVKDFTIDDITISRIVGLVNANAHEEFSIEIGSMPDFLEGDNISLDLASPYIRLHAENPMGIPVDAVLSITAKDAEGANITDPIVFDTISIKQATYNAQANALIPRSNNLYISHHEPTDVWLDAAEKTFILNDTLYTWIHGDLPALLANKIPSSLDVLISAQTDESVEHIALLNGLSSTIAVDCDITVPMELGKDFAINFSGIEGGLEDIFSDFSIKQAAIYVGYNSTLPLDVEMSLLPLQSVTQEVYNSLPADERVADENNFYRIITGIEVGILDANENGKGIIKGTTDMSVTDPVPAADKIVIHLTETADDALQNLSHIQYRVEGNLADGLEKGILRDSQYVQLRLGAKAAGLAIDLDSL